MGNDLENQGSNPTEVGQAQIAQIAPQSGEAVGVVTELTGSATATRSAGDLIELDLGSDIFQGDLLQTDSDSQVSVEFVDGTVFNLGGAARLVMDELVYDPDGASGSLLATALVGTLTFVTGSVAGTSTDAMQLTTPSGTIGIRGTRVGCALGISETATACINLPETDGSFGVWSFTNNVQQVVLRELFEAVLATGLDDPLVTQVLTPDQVRLLLAPLAEDLAELNEDFETEAGPEVLGGGGTFFEFNGQILDGLIASGVLSAVVPPPVQPLTPFPDPLMDEGGGMRTVGPVARIEENLESNLPGGSSPGPTTILRTFLIDFGDTQDQVVISDIELSVFDPDAPDGPIEMPLNDLTSLGRALDFIETTGSRILTAFLAGGDPTDPASIVFIMTIEEEGRLTFEFFQPLDHPDIGETGQDDVLLLRFAFVVTDGVDFANGSVDVLLADDGPQIVGDPINALLDEDDLNGAPSELVFSTGSSPNDGLTNADGSVSVAGSIQTLVTIGADQPGSFLLSNDAQGVTAVSSQGDQVSYSVVGDTLTATADVGGANERVVFTFTLNGDGDFLFTLFDQLDHADGNGENDLVIDFSSLLVGVLDAEGDFLQVPLGSLTITLRDDVPSATGTVENGAVDEENLPTGPEGSSTGGNLAALVTVGADETVRFDLSSNTSNLLPLTSQGQEISYLVVDGTLTAIADAGGAEERIIFQLSLSENSDYLFTLFEQLDHPLGGGDNVLVIDFSSVIQATTDFDGDSVAFQDQTFTIIVTDDQPRVVLGEPGFVSLDEGNLPGGNGDNPGDLSKTATIFIGGDINFGADGPGSADNFAAVEGLSFSSAIAGATAFTSGGAMIILSVSPDGSTLMATAGGLPIFTVTLDAATQSFTVLLQGPIDHLGANGTSISASFNFDVIATDADGDTVTLQNGVGFEILDDAPLARPDSDVASIDGMQTPISGNLIDGTETDNNDLGGNPDPTEADSPGADGVALIRSLRFDDVTMTLSDDGQTLTVVFPGSAPFVLSLATPSSAPAGTAGTQFSLVVLFDAASGQATLVISSQAQPGDGAGGTITIDLFGTGIGDYVYIPPADAPLFPTLSLDYELEDADGDSSIANDSLTIEIDDTPNPGAGDGKLVIDETPGVNVDGIEDDIDPVTDPDFIFSGDALADLQVLLGLAAPFANALSVAQDSFAVNFGINGQGSGGLALDASQPNLGGKTLIDTASGLEIVLQVDAASSFLIGYVGTTDGPIAFVVILEQTADPSGPDNLAVATSTVVQYRAILHDDPTDPDEANDADDAPGGTADEFINVAFTITDADGTQVGGTFTLSFEDDGPTAFDDVAFSEPGGNPIVGNVILGAADGAGADSGGADGLAVIRSVSHGGITYLLSADGSTVTASDGSSDHQFDGTTLSIATLAAGALSIDLTGPTIGAYSFLPPPEGDGGTIAQDVIGYSIEDRDGDQATAQLVLAIDRGGAVPDVMVSANQVCIKEDGSGGFSATVTASGDDVVHEVTFTGLQALRDQGWTVTLEDGGAGGAFASLGGNIVYSAAGNDATVTISVTLSPPANSDRDAFTDLMNDIAVTATAIDSSDGDISDPSTAIIVDVDVDAVLDQALDVTALDRSVTDSDAAAGPISLGATAVFQDVNGQTGPDASESTSVTVTLSTGVLVLDPALGTVVLSDGIYTLQPAGGVSLSDAVAGLAVSVAPEFEGDILVTIRAASQENPTGGDDQEKDLTDNGFLDTASFTITVNGDVPPPDVMVSNNQICIKEDGSGLFTVSVTSFGDDSIETVTLSGLQALRDLGWTVTLDDGSASGSFQVAANGVDILYVGNGESFVLTTVTLVAPADSDLDVLTTLGSDIQVSAVAIDSNGTDRSAPSTAVTVDVDVDAVLDQVADVAGTLGDEGSLLVVEQDPDEAKTVNLGLTLIIKDSGFDGQTAGPDGDQSEFFTVTLILDQPLPDGVTLASGDLTASVTQIDALTFTISGPDLEAAVAGLQVTLPAGFEGTITGQLSATSEELNTPDTVPGSALPSGDIEKSTDDNSVTDQASFSLDVVDAFPSGLAYTVLGGSPLQNPAKAYLYGIDIETGGFEQIGQVFIEGAGDNVVINGLTLDPTSGFLIGFGGTGNFPENLVVIDPTTAETQIIDSDPIYKQSGGLSFTDDGTLYGAFRNEIVRLDVARDASGEILSVERVTVETLANNLNVGSFAINGEGTVAFFMVGTTLYRIDFGVGPADDPNLVTELGVVRDENGTALDVDGLTFDDKGSLFGADDAGNILRIDTDPVIDGEEVRAEIVSTIARNQVTNSGLKSLAISIEDPGTYIHLGSLAVALAYTAFLAADILAPPGEELVLSEEPLPDFGDPYSFADDVLVSQDAAGFVTVTRVEAPEGVAIETLTLWNDDDLQALILGFDAVDIRIGSGNDPSSATVIGAGSGEIQLGVLDQFPSIAEIEIFYELAASDDSIVVQPGPGADGQFLIRSGGGNDSITIDGDGAENLAAAFTIDGGSGDDLVRLVDLSGTLEIDLRGVETLDLSDSRDQSLSLDATDALDSDRVLLFAEHGVVGSNPSTGDLEAAATTLLGSHDLFVDLTEGGGDQVSLSGFTDLPIDEGDTLAYQTVLSDVAVDMQLEDGDITTVFIDVTVTIRIDDEPMAVV